MFESLKEKNCQPTTAKYAFLESNENRDTTCQNLWDTIKVDLKGEFITMND